MEPNITNTVFIFLTPQPNDCDEVFRVKVCADIISTLNEIKKGALVGTYQTCLDTIRQAAEELKSAIFVILSDGELIELEDKDLETILKLEEEAIKAVMDTPLSELNEKSKKNDIRTNAVDFYQSMYCEDNEPNIEEDLVEAITKTNEEIKDVIDNELAVIDKIISAYNIQGNITAITCNDEPVQNNDFFAMLQKIKLKGFTVPGGYVSFKDTKDMKYTISFSSGTKIVREDLDFSVVENNN